MLKGFKKLGMAAVLATVTGLMSSQVAVAEQACGTRDKIVNENSNIRVGSFKYDGVEINNMPSSVKPGHKALSSRFLIAGGAVDLTCEVESRHFPKLEGTI